MCAEEYLKFIKDNIKTDIPLMHTEECKHYAESIINSINLYLETYNKEEEFISDCDWRG